MGSVSNASPTRLGHPGDVALVGLLAQANPAEAELAVHRTRAAAVAAPVVAPGLVLGRARLAHPLGSLGHQSPSLSSPPEAAPSSFASAPSPSAPSPSSPSSVRSGFSYASGFSSF